MKKLLLITALVAALATSAFSDSTISTGSKKGSYYKYGHKLSTFVPSKVITSKGSVQNFDRLLSGKASIAIAQKDAWAWYSSKNPEATSAIEILGDLKMECLYAVAKVDGKVSSDADMQKPGINIATGKIGSGTRVTWDYMSQLEPGFKKATSIPKGGPRALNKIITGDYDVYLSVQTPSTSNKLVKTVLANKDLKFIDITDWDLNDKLPSGEAVYTHEKIDLAKGMFNDTELKTICTTASVFISTAWADDSDDDADTLADALLNNKNFITK